MSEEGMDNASFRVRSSGKSIGESLVDLGKANNSHQKLDLLGSLAALIHMRLASDVDFAKSSGIDSDLEDIQDKIERIARICLEEIHDSPPASVSQRVSFTSAGGVYRDSPVQVKSAEICQDQ